MSNDAGVYRYSLGEADRAGLSVRVICEACGVVKDTAPRKIINLLSISEMSTCAVVFSALGCSHCGSREIQVELYRHHDGQPDT